MVVMMTLLLMTLLPILALAQVSPSSTKFTPSPGSFNGTNTATTKSGICTSFSFSTQLICTGPYVLFDGDFGPSQGYNISKVFAWSQDFDLSFTLQTRTSIMRVNLFFYNNPSIGAGLPNVDGIFWDTANAFTQTNALIFTIAGNQDLNLNDTRLRNVSLIITPDMTVLPYSFIRIHFSFPSSILVTTLLLSEVQLYDTAVSPPVMRSISFLPQPSVITLGAVSPLASYNISCTVMNEGSFVWNWTLPASPIQYQMWIADGTRTTVLQLSHITSDYSGNYVCAVKYRSLTSVANSTIKLQFPTVIVISPNQAFGMLFDYVTFTCEVYGYSSPSTTFSWAVPGSSIPVTMDTLTYQLMNSYGNNSLQNGGSVTGKSPVIKLYLRIPSNKDYGDYTCLYGQYSATATLLLPVAAVSSATTPPSSITITTPPVAVANGASSSFPFGPVIGAVVGCTFLLVVLAAGLIVGVICLKRWDTPLDSSGHQKACSSEPVYSDVSKPEPPPYPAHFFDHTDTYATVDDKHHQGNTHLELETVGGSPAPPPSNGSGTLQKLNVEFRYLRPNPMYTSADNLLESNQVPEQGAGHDFQSLDGVDGVEDSLLDIYAKPLPPGARRHEASLCDSPPPLPQPYNPIYSEALSPLMFTGSDQTHVDATTSSNELLAPYSSIYADPHPLTRAEGPLIVGSQNIREVRPLGIGQFGHVILAETINLSLKDLKMSVTNDDKGVCVLVAIKKLKEGADSTTLEAFEKEIKFMSRLNHENVVRVLGVCPVRSAFIMMEYMENGDLSQYLNKYEFAPPGVRVGQLALPASTLVHMALQVAAGMRYLAQRHFIHRDLATRNCLVGAKHVVKIADFGMSRSLYSNDYYKLRGRAMLPIRWMAKECFYGKFSQKTDVWAFGVVMWEIFTFSKRQPYDEMSDQQVIENAIEKSGRIVLARPHSCPKEVYDVMLQCWDNDPETRATFEGLFQSLTSIHSTMCSDTLSSD
eukprot:Em0016g28a